MARPKKTTDGSVVEAAEVVSAEGADPAAKLSVPRGTVKTVQLINGLDLMASQMSASSDRANIFETPFGLKIVSKKVNRKTGLIRTIVIPFANIKGYELL